MIWTSDNTDSWCRAEIQYSTSLCYPLQTMSNHVSKNRQVGRTIAFKTRTDVAKFGCLGFELNLGLESEENREIVIRETAEYKKDADLILTGDLYRLKNPYTDDCFSQMVVSQDKSKAIIFYMRKSGIYSKYNYNLCLKGIDENAVYFVEETGEKLSGKALIFSGINISVSRGDYSSALLHLSKI